MKETTIQKIRAGKIVAIFRRVELEQVEAAAQALISGGLSLIEVALDHKSAEGRENALQAIKLLQSTFKDRVLVGAGTILSEEDVQMACDAGARYIISPDTNEKVIKCCNRLGVVSMPGALTPSEITKAFEYGADIVKLFPAGEMGVDYTKAIMAPLGHLPLVAVGGINETNIGKFMQSGVIGVGVGSNLVNGSLIKAGRFEELAALAQSFFKQLQ